VVEKKCGSTVATWKNFLIEKAGDLDPLLNLLRKGLLKGEVIRHPLP
jgi:hypothetical protein